MVVRDGIARTKINANGRITLPAELREAIGVKPGDEVLLRVREGELVVYTLAHAIETMQRESRRYLKPGQSLVDELIKERRAEAAKDEAETGAMLRRQRARAQRAR